MDAAWAIRKARELAGLSKRELARRARTSPAAIVAYEGGMRDPTVGTLDRILGAAGSAADIELEPERMQPDPVVSARRLAQVLALADRLPKRPAARRLTYPPFARAR
jgi:transcriptional regulator with XRE-family HTH domain